jgi:hypothetical protein
MVMQLRSKWAVGKARERSVLALPSREEAKRGRFAYIGTFDFPAK